MRYNSGRRKPLEPVPAFVVEIRGAGLGFTEWARHSAHLDVAGANEVKRSVLAVDGDKLDVRVVEDILSPHLLEEGGIRLVTNRLRRGRKRIRPISVFAGKGKGSAHAKTIAKYDWHGQLVEIYPTTRAAAKGSNLSEVSIKRCYTGVTPWIQQYTYVLVKPGEDIPQSRHDLPPVPLVVNNEKAVVKCNDAGVLEEYYFSYSKAARANYMCSSTLSVAFRKYEGIVKVLGMYFRKPTGEELNQYGKIRRSD